jgi:radical SAM superfamily enzyme with C-terminal helix-hairpin-helix motif
MKILLIDGYVDEPACLGVPPYLSPYVRYLWGALKQANPNAELYYRTIDQVRPWFKTEKIPLNIVTPAPTELDPNTIDFIFILSGVAVPGKYLGGVPLKPSEISPLMNVFPKAIKVFCGPAIQFGIGEEGGKASIPVEKVASNFDIIVKGDAEKAVALILTEQKSSNSEITVFRQSMEENEEFALKGVGVIEQHPNFRISDGGNLICEIETFRGCPRYQTGGCRFCVEPTKGKTMHRSIPQIVDEIGALYDLGVRHFRLGNQTDFYAFQHGTFDDPRYPRPNPNAIIQLLQGIRMRCPQIKTLHIDNVNALNFAIYPEEARSITQAIVDYCTPGNIAAIGVESIDPVVKERNNLKATESEILSAVQIINECGAGVGENGMPKFLPGLNFIMGLPGETKKSLEMNYNLLHTILEKGWGVRRINLRKLLVSENLLDHSTIDQKKQYKSLYKNEHLYYSWKDRVRNEIDFPLLKKLFPIGRILSDVFAEVKDHGGTYLRQVGTYPILCYVPRVLKLHEFYTLVVVDHGFRSLNCLVLPLILPELTRKELESINGIGQKRAKAIIENKPILEEEWLKIIPIEVWNFLAKFRA